MKLSIEAWAPPWLLRGWRNWRRAVRHEGDYPSWAAALSASTGYTAANNLSRVREAALRVRNGEAAFERDGIAFNEIEVAWPLLACVQTVAASHGGRLDVVDFGGSLGSTYFQYRSFFRQLSLVRWRVVEQPEWVAAGRLEFESSELRFYDTLDAALADGEAPQLLLLSGVLPYLPEPVAFLREVAARPFSSVIIDRTGVLHFGERDRLTVQRVRPPPFHASYPCWFFTRETLLVPFTIGYRLAAEFPALDGTNIAADYRGFFFQRWSGA